ncbi:MAG: hypothetical protein JRC68_06660 [Deltaproteobacteria bacterium]|nr:hypothetical protein [Deltaproteobacteria bacterium]
MEKNSSKRLSTNYLLIATTAVILFMATALALIAYEYKRNRSGAMANFQEKLSERVHLLEDFYAGITRYIDSMVFWAEDYLNNPDNADDYLATMKLMRINPKSSFFLHNLTDKDSRHQLGMAFGKLPAYGSMKDYFQEVSLCLGLLSVQRASHSTMPYLKWSYYISHKDISSLYPTYPYFTSQEDTVERTTALLETNIQALRKKDYWVNVSPQNNPERKRYWSDIHFDYASKSLIITHSAPLYYKDQFMGVIASDIQTEALNQIVVPFAGRHGKFILVNNNKQVLAYSDHNQKGAKTVTLLENVLPQGGPAFPLQHNKKEEYFSWNDHYTFTRSSEEGRWTLIYMIPSRVALNLFLPAVIVDLGLVLCLILLAVLAHFLIRYHFVRPAISLIDHIHTEAIMGPTPIPKVPAAWKPWFIRLSDTLHLKSIAANLPGAIYQVVRYKDGRLKTTFVSTGIKDLLEVHTNDDDQLNPLESIPEHLRTKFLDIIERSTDTDGPVNIEYEIPSLSGNKKWVRLAARPRTGFNGETIWDGLALDITDRKHVEQDRERVIAELQEALDRIKTLDGLIPICSSCKKIRDDKGYWNQVESYISRYSDAEFTHSICPNCAKKLYPELFNNNNDEG